MNNKTLEEHLRRARSDPSFRQHLLENARYARTMNGWAALVFAVIALTQIFLTWSNGQGWDTDLPKTAALGVLIGVMMFTRFGDRVAMLVSLGNVSNNSPDPTPSSGTSPAGQEPRLR